MIFGNLSLIFYYLVYLAAVFATGSLFLKIFKLDFGSKTEEKVYQFAFGNLVYSYLILYLGIFHLLYKEVVLLVFIFPAILLIIKLIPELKSFIKNLKKFFKQITQDKRRLVGESLVVFILALAFFPLVFHLFSFPTSWDPLAYHLTLLKVYLKDHTFSFYNWFPQTGFPIGIDTLFGYGEAVSDPRVSNFINFGFIIATVVYFVYGLRYLFSRKVLLLALFLFLFSPLFYSEVTVTPFIDFPFAFYGLITGITLVKFLRSQKTDALLLLLLLGFFAFMIKYTGLFVFLSLSFLIAIRLTINFGRNKKLENFKSFLGVKFWLTLAIAVIPLFYWLVRNFIYAQNPLYPFLNDVFKGLDYNPSYHRSIIALVREENAGNIGVFGLLYFGSFILFAAIGLFSKEKTIKYLSRFGLLIVFPIVFLVGPLLRYYLPAVPILAICTSFIFFDLFKKLKWHKLPFILLLIVILLNQTYSAFRRGKYFFFSTFKTSFASFSSYQKARAILNAQDNYPAIDYINSHLDKDRDKVMVVFDNRLYYFDVPAIYANQSVSGLFTNPKTKTIKEIYEELKDMKITYVFVNNNWGIYPNLRKDLYYPFVEKYLEPVFSASGTVLYRVK